MFQSEVGEADWENHPKREEWIAEMRQGKGRFVAQGGPPEEWETRKAFADWAITNNLVWGNNHEKTPQGADAPRKGTRSGGRNLAAPLELLLLS